MTLEFTPKEKRILEMLHKKYGEKLSEYNMWQVAAELIEDFNLDYETAYSLSRTYSWSGYDLFAPTKPLRKTVPLYKLFYDHLYDLTSNYAKINENNFTTRVRFNGDVGTESIEDRDILLSGMYDGLNMYVPPKDILVTPHGREYISYSDSKYRTISIYITFNPMDLNGNIKNINSFQGIDETDDDNKDEFKVITYYREDLSSNNDNKIMLLSFNVPYPKPLTKENVYKTFDLIVKDVLEYISNTTFDLPAGAEPIVVNN